HEGWNEDRKYGFTVTELEDGKHIYDESKFATAEEMEDFCSFYNEFKTRAVTEPWEPRPGLAGTALERTRKTVEGWIRLSEAVGRLRPEDYQPYVDRYFAVMERHAAGTRLEFTHRELTAEQIIKTDGGYAITANILWGYMPEWADLSPNIWHSLLFVRSADATPERVIEYVDAWIDAYGRIPAAGKDPDFEKKIVLALLNRVVGTLTGDLGAGWQWGDGKPGRPYLKRTLVFEQRLFDHLEARLSGL
ncbi:hypothetical protein M1329_01520, partial [Candidatus Marsarchaeota archaeon]|nr:hypothetical protein [Candidatus Marsarchaeota archaeon]